MLKNYDEFYNQSNVKLFSFWENKHIIFDIPFEQRWVAAAQALGINVNLISNIAGHA